MLQNVDDLDNESFLSCLSDEESSGDDSFSSIPTLCDNLSNQFSDVPKNFNAVHLNAQSIPAHYPEMLASFSDKNLHAILVSETWFKPCLPSTSYDLPGFTLIRNDRTGNVGGGVAIYLRSHISYSLLSMSSQPPPVNAGEHLFIEVILAHTKLLIGVFYSPSLRINYFSSLDIILNDLTPSYPHHIIMGDFNTCLLKKDHRSAALESTINSYNLHILPLKATHTSPNCTPSLLDLIFVSSLQHVAKHGQFPADSFSCHDLIFLSYKLRPPKTKPKILQLRSFSTMDVEKLHKDARGIDWSLVLSADNIEDKVNQFNALLLQLYDTHAPLRAVKIKHHPAPWLTNEIKKLIHAKAVAKSRLKCNKNDLNKQKYVLARNRCNIACRDAQRHHIHKSVQNEDPAKVWKFLRSLGVGKQRQNSMPLNLNLNSLNQHFSSSSTMDANDKIATLNYLSSLPTPNYLPFVLSEFTACDVRKSILSICSNAIGGDGISRNMLVPILNEILPILCHILNSSVSEGAVPSCWKEAHIIPLPKKSNPKSLSEYRPISILPLLSKVLERLVHTQLSCFLNRNNLLNPYQSGFRPGHSTVSALIKVTDDIRLGMENRLLTVLTLLDFSNAFNTVDFEILLALLRSLNISPSVIHWFHSYLYGRRQRVRIEDVFSSWSDTSAGVPQGGVLSPLLFAIFINSISFFLSSSYHLYADDLQIYTQSSLENLNDAIKTTNDDLCRISNWSRSYGLTVNPTKTQAIIVGSSRLVSKIDFSSVQDITFNNVIVPLSKQVKNLGVIMDSNLTWDPQLQSVSCKLFASAASLRRLRNFLPTATKAALAQSLLLPILDYADASYLDLREDQLNKLERLQNFCIRFIFGLRKFDHVSEFRAKLKWLPIRLRRNTHILSFLYGILFNPSTPPYLKARFHFLSSSNSLSLRSSENMLLDTPAHSTNFYDSSFTVQAVRLWNELPIVIRRAQSIDSFKEQVRKFYLSSVR